MCCGHNHGLGASKVPQETDKELTIVIVHLRLIVFIVISILVEAITLVRILTDLTHYNMQNLNPIFILVIGLTAAVQVLGIILNLFMFKLKKWALITYFVIPIISMILNLISLYSQKITASLNKRKVRHYYVL